MTGNVRAAMVAAGVATVVVAASCGGSSSPRANPRRSGGNPAATKSRGIDPNAPEVVAPGDIPDTQAFVTFAGAGFSFKVPEGWSRSSGGATTSFTDHYNTVAAATTNAPLAPTVASTRAADVSALRTDVPNFQLVNVALVQRSAGPVVLVTYRAGSPADPVTGKRVAIDVERYAFWRNGTQVTLTLSGARGSDNVDPWKTITDSFAWTS